MRNDFHLWIEEGEEPDFSSFRCTECGDPFEPITDQHAAESICPDCLREKDDS